MADGEIRFVGELARVDFRSGDRFVLFVRDDATAAYVERVRVLWASWWPDDAPAPPLLILTGDMRLGVIGPADPETPETGEASA